AKLLKDKVSAVEVVDPYRVRFRLKEAWPDFMTFYATPASGAAWIVPKKYVEKVGDEGFKKAPIGAGPYKVASFNPGVEMVLDAHDRYWRKTPAGKRLVWETVTGDLRGLARTQADAHRDRGLSMVQLWSAAVGSEIALARPAGPPGGRARLRQERDQPGRDPGVLQAHWRDHSGGLRVRPAASALSVRPGAGQEAPGRGRLSKRLRRRRVRVRRVLLDRRRGDRELSGRGRHPHQAAPGGARGVPRRLEGQEDHRDPAGGRRRGRERGHPGPQILRPGRGLHPGGGVRDGG